jgi:hypothetical protein
MVVPSVSMNREQRRRLPRADMNEGRVLGFPARVRPGPVHLIHCIEAEVRGVFEIKCSCGEVTWTPWGEASATEIAEIHLWARGVPVRGRVSQR